MNYLTSMDIHI